MAAKLTATLEQSKETKNKVQYREDGDNPLIQTIYLPKAKAEKMGEKIRVTIEAAE